jgi:hypothetical protein
MWHATWRRVALVCHLACRLKTLALYEHANPKEERFSPFLSPDRLVVENEINYIMMELTLNDDDKNEFDLAWPLS